VKFIIMQVSPRPDLNLDTVAANEFQTVQFSILTKVLALPS